MGLSNPKISNFMPVAPKPFTLHVDYTCLYCAYDSYMSMGGLRVLFLYHLMVVAFGTEGMLNNLVSLSNE